MLNERFRVFSRSQKMSRRRSSSSPFSLLSSSSQLTHVRSEVAVEVAVDHVVLVTDANSAVKDVNSEAKDVTSRSQSLLLPQSKVRPLRLHQSLLRLPQPLQLRRDVHRDQHVANRLDVVELVVAHNREVVELVDRVH